MIIQNDDGEDVEVFTAEEVVAKETAARTAAESEFGKTKVQIEQERDEARTALAARSGEVVNIRRLSDEQVKALNEKDRIIYENGLVLAKANEDRILQEQKTRDATVDGVIKGKVGDNTKLFDEVKRLWPVVLIDANTPDEIAAKTTMVLGMISTQSPDLVASANGFTGGSYAPPAAARPEGESFADTDAGKALAADLGLPLQAPKA